MGFFSKKKRFLSRLQMASNFLGYLKGERDEKKDVDYYATIFKPVTIQFCRLGYPNAQGYQLGNIAYFHCLTLVTISSHKKIMQYENQGLQNFCQTKMTKPKMTILFINFKGFYINCAGDFSALFSVFFL